MCRGRGIYTLDQQATERLNQVVSGLFKPSDLKKKGSLPFRESALNFEFLEVRDALPLL